MNVSHHEQIPQVQKSCLGKNYSFEIERKKKDYYYVNHYSVAKEEAKAKNRSHAELSSLSETKAKPWEREGKKRSVTCMNFKERAREKNARKHVKKGPRARVKEKEREREKKGPKQSRLRRKPGMCCSAPWKFLQCRNNYKENVHDR